MASNSFGTIFKITTWGESHGKAIGVVIDGCPAGIALTEADINQELALRAPGKSRHTSPRQEKDQAEIYSGIFEGFTTGTPISIIIHNNDADPKAYETSKNLLKPGHAKFTYTSKYGIYDYRGGGRASARETACRVAAGAVAKKMLEHFSIQTCAYLYSVKDIQTNIRLSDVTELRKLTYTNPIYCPDAHAATLIIEKLDAIKAEGNSLGGVVEFIATGLPVGLGDPVYEKLESSLAKAMLSIPATKGFEMGEGFHATQMTGSTHNDTFAHIENTIQTTTNHAGGTLGGISTGMPIIGRVAFKPTSSIRIPQATVDDNNNAATFTLAENARHDPCVAIRAVPVVEAMCALVLVDALLMNRLVKL